MVDMKQTDHSADDYDADYVNYFNIIDVEFKYYW